MLRGNRVVSRGFLRTLLVRAWSSITSLERVLPEGEHNLPMFADESFREKCCYAIALSSLQCPGELIRIENNSRWKCSGIDQLERARRSSLCHDAFPRAQQNRIDRQQNFIGQP